MDVITLFQALLNAWGLSFNATQYAQHSTYVVTKQDVDMWWESQTTSFKNKWSKLAMPSRMMLWAMGESDFVDTMNVLQEYLNNNPNVPYRTADQFMNAYSTAINSAQQNSINYTKDSVTKTAFDISSNILSSTKIIADAVINGAMTAKPVIDTVNAVKSVVQAEGIDWNFNWVNLTNYLSSVLDAHTSDEYRYIYVALSQGSGSYANARGVFIWLSNTYSKIEYGLWTPSAVTSSGGMTNYAGADYWGGEDRNNLNILDASHIIRGYSDMYGSTFINTDSNFILYDDLSAYITNANSSKKVSSYIYDANKGDTVSDKMSSQFITTAGRSVIIDRKASSSKKYAVVKDVVGVGQTIIGVTNDSTDEEDERVFIMNTEGVETLARTDAGAYPEVLPSTIAAQIVDIGASVTDAVSDIANKNPEYPYVPPTPIVNSTGNNLFTLYNVTPTEMSNLADYLWSTNFIDSFKKFFSNPSDSLISLVGYPVDVKSSGAKNIKIGYTDSGVSSHVITDYIQEFDLGSVYIPKFYNNFLDNNPYTKVSIYLPFIGSCSLDSDIVVGATIKIKYRVELLTANCVALLSVSNINGTYPIYQFNGNLGMQFPLSSGSYASIYKNLISTGISAVAAYASGGALTPLAIASAANTVVGSKSEVSKSGNMNGSSGYCGMLKPYVIVERPVTDIPSAYANYNGVVTNMALSVGSLHGYCVMENVDVSTIPCSESERAEITNLLLNGFFV